MDTDYFGGLIVVGIILVVQFVTLALYFRDHLGPTISRMRMRKK
jgi:hypothetical protein